MSYAGARCFGALLIVMAVMGLVALILFFDRFKATQGFHDYGTAGATVLYIVVCLCMIALGLLHILGIITFD